MTPESKPDEIRFQADLRFDIRELAQRTPEQIDAILRGVSLVMAAESGHIIAALRRQVFLLARELAWQTERLERQWCC